MSKDIRKLIGRCRRALLLVGAFSGLINLLALTGSVYMLQLYDRVLPSRSIPTLVGLSLLLVLLYAGASLLDVLRGRMMGRVGLRIDRLLRERLFSIILNLPLSGRHKDVTQPLRDLETIRSFLSGPGPIALFDLPWLPVYLALVYLLHPWLGLLGAGGALLLLVVTLIMEVRSREPARSAVASGSERLALVQTAARNAEAVRALGMRPHLGKAWLEASEQHLGHCMRASDLVATYSSVSRSLRLVLQSAVLGLGAYLVILNEATAGVMIAASILVARALAPVEIAIGNWRGLVSARQSLTRIRGLLDAMPARAETLALPAPSAQLKVEGLAVGPPGQKRVILHNVSFAIAAGSAVGVLGASAAGKSSLVRTLVGAWPPLAGSVRLDDAALDQWCPDALGQHIGYLPQEIEFFRGTVAQNIARFDPAASSHDVIAAARHAGIHELVVRLPDGYETNIGEDGSALSVGQKQRIALARALYGEPFLVVLDEPNAHLDAEGDAALTHAILGVRQRGGIVVVVAHRPAALAGVDQLLVLSNGHVQAFGPKDEVMRKLAAQPASIQPQRKQGLPV